MKEATKKCPLVLFSLFLSLILLIILAFVEDKRKIYLEAALLINFFVALFVSIEVFKPYIINFRNGIAAKSFLL